MYLKLAFCKLFYFNMKLLYSIGIFFYNLLIKFSSGFNSKAKLRKDGVNFTFETLKSFNSKHVIWVHCASLGEFEQGRPLIEKIKQKYSDYQIALSFFSPSGYEIRKKYELADLVFYLPGDSFKNAKKLISLLNPKLVFFVKYEFWYWYLRELKNQQIPTYLISGIFRKKQIFFKFYGSFFRKILKNFTHLFVQNTISADLLKQAGIQNVSITGDTRFDRVFEIASNRKRIEIIENFIKDKLVFVAGSTWKPDEDIIFQFMNLPGNKNVKYIIAPHEIKNENIKRIINLADKNVIRYSESNSENILSTDILIIDNIGLLSSVYAYADVAYIGGGFGAGIHNTLEAAVYGIPVIFGSKYQKFDEAKELIKRKAGFSITNKEEFNVILQNLIRDINLRMQSGKNAEMYIKENIGATEKILTAVSL